MIYTVGVRKKKFIQLIKLNVYQHVLLNKQIQKKTSATTTTTTAMAVTATEKKMNKKLTRK